MITREWLVQAINGHLLELEQILGSDILTYNGGLYEPFCLELLRVVENLVEDKKRDRLTVILTTRGGSAHAVERCVNIIRKHYANVDFIVPEHAYSAGTIFCMSGDDIFMDYFSVLGPIDPQVLNKDQKWVAALGYIEKIEELLDKDRRGDLTATEFLILKDFDLAELRGYEQARDLAVALLKTWLVQYKFKNWTVHETDPELIGQAVTEEQKTARAVDIARKLQDTSVWKDHSRGINMTALINMKLKINDLGRNPEIRNKIHEYHELFSFYMSGEVAGTSPVKFALHTRNHL